MDKINILGINISALTKDETLEKIEGYLGDGGQHQIATPNPEFLAAAGKDEEFYHILNRADLAVPDGIGLVLASRLLGRKISRLTGVDLIYEIAAIAEKKDKSVFLLGASPGVAETAARKLKQKHPGLRIAGADEGLPEGSWEMKADRWTKGGDMNEALISRIKAANPDIIFVAFGHPKQDKWIFHNLKLMPSVKVAIGIGGGLDFVSGKAKRAPAIFQKSYLEWLWRLFLEPWRYRRIIDAIIVFPFRFFLAYHVYPFLYRPNVVCLLYKKEGARFKIFITERSDEAGHWQLPQGGTDGEKIGIAGERELREETGTDRFEARMANPNLFKYEFGRNGYPQGSRFSGYKGQKQGLFIAEFIGNDDDIKVNYWDHADWKWVDSENLLDEIPPIRREATAVFLRKFREFIQKNRLGRPTSKSRRPSLC